MEVYGHFGRNITITKFLVTRKSTTTTQKSAQIEELKSHLLNRSRKLISQKLISILCHEIVVRLIVSNVFASLQCVLVLYTVGFVCAY
jgi:hypothetical protein